MPDVEWTRAVERASKRLSGRAEADFLATVARLYHFPEIFPLVQEGRYRGCRRATIQPHWNLYYRVSPTGRPTRLVALIDARRRPR